MTGFIGTPSMQDIERLEARLAEVERKLEMLKGHAHRTSSYNTGPPVQGA